MFLQPFNIPPPQAQGQSTGYPHDLNKQSQVPPRLSAQGAGLVQPATMYQQTNMRPQGSMVCSYHLMKIFVI